MTCSNHRQPEGAPHRGDVGVSHDMDRARLLISLHRGPVRPVPGTLAWNEWHGGPETLLQWLETQLGLQAERPSRAERVHRYAHRLGALPGATFSASLATDAWSTAENLLARRDELRLAGWDGADAPALPPLVRDLARVESAGAIAGDAERLDDILAALDDGQRLPPHEVRLLEPAPEWPALWRRVLARLRTVEEAAPAAAGEGSLLALQRALLDGSETTTSLDDGRLVHVRALSAAAACQALAATLAADAPRMARTVVLCEDDATAQLLDAALARIGAPTMGAERPAPAPPLQVLPLALALCWRPVDPRQLVDFLNLPVRPIATHAARALSDALAEHPGLGSRAWEAAWAKLVAPEVDPEGELRASLEAWFDVPRVARGAALPVGTVRACCSRVAQWAAGRAQLLDEDDPLRGALQAAANQASLVGEFVESAGHAIGEAQLRRLIDATRAAGPVGPPHAALTGGPRRARSLADIPPGYTHLVWLGLDGAHAHGPPWAPAEREALAARGIALPLPHERLAANRRAERAGFARITQAALFVELAHEEERAPHGVWTHARSLLDRAGRREPDLIERILDGSLPAPAAWPMPIAERAPDPALPRRQHWMVDAALLAPLERSSPTELDTRLACPLRWVLQRQARLYPGRAATIPEGTRLVGNFAHALFADLFGHGGPPPAVEDAARAAEALFERLLPLDAAALALPGAAAERARARHRIVHAVREFVRMLHAGGYQVKAMEAAFDGTIGADALHGRLDALLEAQDGSEAIVDLKYSRSRYYEDLLSEGRAVQLATYAHLRRSAGATVHGVAYLLLNGRGLRTPEGSPLRGADNAHLVAGAPAIDETWARFAEAIEDADGWRSDGVVPVRPAQEPTAWPAGATLVLKPDAPESVCRYCDHTRLCGATEVR